MADGFIPSPDFNEQLKRAVRENERRLRSEINRRARWHKKGGGGGGEIIKFTIDNVDCTDIANPLWNVAWTHYTKACTEPPGVDEYTGLIEVIPPCNVPFTDAELEASGSGFAIQMYAKEAEGVDCSVDAWYAFDICADNGCTE